jgi:hypothetical protein
VLVSPRRSEKKSRSGSFTSQNENEKKEKVKTKSLLQTLSTSSPSPCIIQAAPLYLAETSPTRWRGGFTTAYHFFLVAGTLVANVANYFTNRIPDWGWRVSLGLAAVPATVIVTGALFVSDTPSSLVLRGEPDSARASLQRIRGADADVEAEFKDIVRAVEEARRNEEGAFTRLLRGKGYRHYLVAIPAFFDLTGMVVISVFSPVLFRTVGFDSQKAIFGAVIISLVSLCGVVLSTLAVDRCGRRFLFLAGGTAMLLFQVCKLFMPVPLLVVMYVRACVL